MIYRTVERNRVFPVTTEKKTRIVIERGPVLKVTRVRAHLSSPRLYSDVRDDIPLT